MGSLRDDSSWGCSGYVNPTSIGTPQAWRAEALQAFCQAMKLGRPLVDPTGLHETASRATGLLHRSRPAAASGLPRLDVVLLAARLPSCANHDALGQGPDGRDERPGGLAHEAAVVRRRCGAALRRRHLRLGDALLEQVVLRLEHQAGRR